MAQVQDDVAGAPARKRPGRPSLSNEELLDTALDLFLENGFDRTSIEAICAAAGMAKRTVYARYGDKTSLFKAALTRAIREWIVPVEQLRALETPDFEETLHAIGLVLLENILSPAGLRLMRLTNAEAGRMPEIAITNVRQGTDPTIAYLADFFRRRLGADSLFGEAEEAATAFLALVVGGPASNAAWGVPFDPADIERHTRYSVKLFLHGLLPPPPHQVAGEADKARLCHELGEIAAGLEAARDRLEQLRQTEGEAQAVRGTAQSLLSP